MRKRCLASDSPSDGSFSLAGNGRNTPRSPVAKSLLCLSSCAEMTWFVELLHRVL